VREAGHSAAPGAVRISEAIHLRVDIAGGKGAEDV